MATLIRITKFAGPAAGIGALTLGLMHWFLNISFIGLHIFFGAVVTLALLVTGIVGLSISGLRVMGMAAVALAPVVPLFGMTQTQILVGDLHWLIRVAHLLVGFAAVGLTERIGERYSQIGGQTAGMESVSAA